MDAMGRGKTKTSRLKLLSQSRPQAGCQFCQLQGIWVGVEILDPCQKTVSQAKLLVARSSHRRCLFKKCLNRPNPPERLICARVDQLPILGMGGLPPSIGNPHNGAL